MHENCYTHTGKKPGKLQKENFLQLKCHLFSLQCTSDPTKMDILQMSDVVIASSKCDRVLINARINCSLHGDALLGI